MGLHDVKEKTWHVFAAVQAIVEFCLLHTLIIFSLKAHSESIPNFKHYEIVDVVYFIAALSFFALWLMNLSVPAAILEWTILFLAILLQIFASNRCVKTYDKLASTESMKINMSAVLLMLYVIFTVVTLLLIAPPVLTNDENSESLHTSVIFCIIIASNAAYTTKSYLDYDQCGIPHT